MNCAAADVMAIPYASGSFQAVVFSPPYFGLRFYAGTAKWVGGDPECDHVANPKATKVFGNPEFNINRPSREETKTPGYYADTCPKCGAVCEDKQLGSEKLHDCLGWATGNRCGECFICHTVQYMREVKRVLRDDGVCWMNISDSYAGSNKGFMANGSQVGGTKQLSNVGSVTIKSKRMPRGNGRWGGGNQPAVGNLKPKDLCLIPERVALALQADGWFVRAPVIWHKPNPMPGSQQDRPTIDFEFVWMLTKKQHYYFDMEAVREDNADPTRTDYTPGKRAYTTGNNPGLDGDTRPLRNDGFLAYKNGKTCNGRSMRAVWTIPTQPYSGSHYATYPEELVLRCLKASTSEKGACPKCGKPWKRVVEKESYITRPTIGRDTQKSKQKPEFSGGLARVGGHVAVDTATLGWEAQCKCGIDYTVPCRVMDPFIGSGTTIVAARRLGLTGYGSDLSLQYLAENARERINQDAPWF